MLWLDRTHGGSRFFLDVRPPAGDVVRLGERLPAWWRTSVVRWAAQILVLLGLTAPAGPAQATQVPRVGILSPYTASASSFQDDVKRGLTNLGYVEGTTVLYELRFADGRTDHLPALAADLVQRNVDVIVTATAPAVRNPTRRKTLTIRRLSQAMRKMKLLRPNR
jgi:hypothetical protein